MMSEKYAGKVLREEKEGQVPCWVLELVPTPKGPSYAKIIAWVGKDDSLTRRVDFYDDTSDRPFKRLILSSIKKAGSKPVAHQLTMTNLLDKTKTVMIIDRIKFGVKIPASLFESRNLEK
jgi:outer membrane lipoprotein-sorting protein